MDNPNTPTTGATEKTTRSFPNQQSNGLTPAPQDLDTRGTPPRLRRCHWHLRSGPRTAWRSRCLARVASKYHLLSPAKTQPSWAKRLGAVGVKHVWRPWSLRDMGQEKKTTVSLYHLQKDSYVKNHKFRAKEILRMPGNVAKL